MAGVHSETPGQGKGHHEFDYMPLSDASVILKLIQNRMTQDATYGAKLFSGDILSSNGGMAFVDNIINTYIDLDRVISEANLSKAQKKVVELSMAGWSSADIAGMANVLPQTIDVHLRRAAQKIAEANDHRWKVFANTMRKYQEEKNNG